MSQIEKPVIPESPVIPEYHNEPSSSSADDHHHNNPPLTLDFSAAAIKNYCLTRFTSIIPSKKEFQTNSKSEIFNPFKPLRELTGRQWNFFFAGFWCWTWDAFGYFSVALNVAQLAKTFDVPTTTITWGITLVLMLRTVGAVVFGLVADRYGRVYPLVVAMVAVTVLQLGLGFVHTYKQFLAVRALFGIFMGGIFGPAAALSLEDSPVKAHGMLSGMFQQGYAFGYLLVICFQRAITDNSSHGWRSLMWFSAGPSVLFAIWVVLLGETDSFKKHRELSLMNHSESPGKRFAQQGKVALKQYWLVIVYMVLLMAGFNFMSHGSQDLYPTLLSVELGFGNDRSTVTNAVANLGAITGGLIFGHASNFLGRRSTIMICCIGGGALIYPWAFLKSSAINAGAFFLQFFVQGAFGVVPIHLSELSPPQFRSFVSGIAYQLGNLASSASSTIESTIGERFPLYDSNGLIIDGKFNYSKVMAIFMGCVFGYLLLITFVGPENKDADLGFSNEVNDSEPASETSSSKEVDSQKLHETRHEQV